MRLAKYAPSLVSHNNRSISQRSAAYFPPWIAGLCTCHTHLGWSFVSQITHASRSCSTPIRRLLISTSRNRECAVNCPCLQWHELRHVPLHAFRDGVACKGLRGQRSIVHKAQLRLITRDGTFSSWAGVRHCSIHVQMLAERVGDSSYWECGASADASSQRWMDMLAGGTHHRCNTSFMSAGVQRDMKWARACSRDEEKQKQCRNS